MVAPVKKAVSLLNGAIGKFHKPKRYVVSGQRQRAGSLYSQNYHNNYAAHTQGGLPGAATSAANNKHEVFSMAAASIYGGAGAFGGRIKNPQYEQR